MMTLETERIRRLRAGKAEALASILNEHWDGLVRHAQGLLDSRDDAEDAVQEAFIRRWVDTICLLIGATCSSDYARVTLGELG